MKLVFQAIVASMVIHLIYAIIMITVGYIQTRNYEPDFTDANVVILQDEISFGVVYSPSLFIVTFLGVAVICGLIILFYKNIKQNAR